MEHFCRLLADSFKKNMQSRLVHSREYLCTRIAYEIYKKVSAKHFFKGSLWLKHSLVFPAHFHFITFKQKITVFLKKACHFLKF